MTTTRDKIYVFVTDTDNCLLSITHGGTHLLDTPLIDIAKNPIPKTNGKQYAAWAMCTHRCILSAITPLAEGEDAFYSQVVNFLKAQGKPDPFDFMLHRVVEHFGAQVKDKECIAVSTLDDLAELGSEKNSGSGFAYQHILLPLEKQIIEHNASTKTFSLPEFKAQHATCTRKQFDIFAYSKNRQYVQLAERISAWAKAHPQYANCDVEIHVFDDKIHLCQQITSIPITSLPDNIISIKSFCHCTAEKIQADLERPTAEISRPTLVRTVDILKKLSATDPRPSLLSRAAASEVDSDSDSDDDYEEPVFEEVNLFDDYKPPSFTL